MNPFYAGLADIFEVSPERIDPTFSLAAHNWDSLAIISCVALIDECFRLLVSGSLLGQCKTVADLEALVAQTVAA